MKVFLTHTASDHDIVLQIYKYLKDNGFDVWIDECKLECGDLLIPKISKAIDDSDRLIACLSPEAVKSRWVTEELAIGKLNELGENKGCGMQFVIPAILKPCDVPYFVKKVMYVSFVDKTLEAAYLELKNSLLRVQRTISEIKLTKNEYAVYYKYTYEKTGKPGMIIELGVGTSPTEGAKIIINFNKPVEFEDAWFNRPKEGTPPLNNCGIAYQVFSQQISQTQFFQQFQQPNITSSKSYYLRFKHLDGIADAPKSITFGSFFG